MTPDATSPQGTADDATLSFDQGVDDITNLLGDPATDLSAEDQGQNAEAGEETGDEPALDLTEETAEQGDVDAQGADGSEEVKGGRFAPDTAKVTLDDGTVISIAELKRNNLFQRDYTRKTTELKQEREAFESQRSQVGEYARNLTAQRDLILQAAQYFMPQRPDRTMIGQDVIGYNEAVADYEERMGVLNQLFQHANAEQARIAQEQENAQQEIVARESTRLVEAMPELRDPAKYREFWNEAVTVMNEYGFTQAELDQAADHRFYKVYRDLMKYHRALKRAPQVQQDMQNKPRLMPGGKRMDPKAKNSREQQARSEQLRKTGTMQAGIASLMDLDL